MTRARFGFTYIHLSRSFSDTVNNIYFVSYLGTNKMIVRRVTSLTSPQVFNTTDNILIGIEDRNGYPFGFFYNDMKITLNLNMSVLQKTFLRDTNSFNLTLAISYFNQPKILTGFDFTQVEEKVTYLWNTSTFLTDDSKEMLTPQIWRWEAFHPAFYTISLIFYGIVFVLLVLLSQHQPLKSRGIYPYFMAVFQIISLFPAIFHFVFPFQNYRWICGFDRLLLFPLQLTCISVPIFAYLRYVIMLNINYKKTMYAITKKEFLQKHTLKSSSKSIYYLKIFGHWGFHLVLIVSAIIIYTIIFVSYFMIAYWVKGIDYVCQIENFEPDVLFRVLICCVFLLFLIILTYDLILQIYNAVQFKKSFFQIITEDIFYFRVEVIVIGLLITIPFKIIILILEATVFADKNLNIPERFYTYCLLLGFEYHLLYIMNCLFVLLLTIIKLLISCCIKKEKDSALLKYLKDEQFYSLFSDYLNQEFSQENLVCYMDIQKFKNEKNETLMTTLAREIVDSYFNGSESGLEVNVDKKSCQAVKDRLNSTMTIDATLFDDCERTVKTNLYDSFSRFQSTQGFKVWEKRKNEIETLIN